MVGGALGNDDRRLDAFDPQLSAGGVERQESAVRGWFP
jgi:hypothetical protein